MNANEYIKGFENHFTRMLFECEKPVQRHCVDRAQFIFRKPFFPGQRFAIEGQLTFKGYQTLMLAGFYEADEDGKLSPRPSVFTRMEGSITA